MKTPALAFALIVPLLFACVPRKPQVPLIEVPAGPLLQTLEQHARSFRTLRALGSVQVSRKDRRRTFESAGILVKGPDRFRIEAYGPLGETVTTLLWTGRDLVLDLDGKRRTLPGSALGRVLGADVDPSDLCAILSGNVPGISAGPAARLLCAADGACFLEFAHGKSTIRAQAPRAAEEDIVPSYEVYQGDDLAYRVRFESFERTSGYRLPAKIVVEKPDNRSSLTVEYAEAEVNVPLGEQTFAPPGTEGGD